MKKAELTRKEFIAETGVFVTHTYFDISIKEEYIQSELTKEEYLKDIINDGRVIELADNTKVFIDDDNITQIGGDKDIEDLTTMDLLENLSEEFAFWQNRYMKQNNFLHEIGNEIKQYKLLLKPNCKIVS